MLTRSDIPNLLLPGLKTVFYGAYEAADSRRFEQVATIIPSDKAEEKYGWLGAIPTMRQWKDERIPAGLKEHKYSLENLDYEASIAVHKNAIADDQYGQIKIRVQEMGQEAARHSEQIVFEAIAAGFATICYDGQYFFDTDHPSYDSDGNVSGTQTNKGTSALSASSLQDAVTAMMRFTNDKGKPMGIIPDTIVVGPELWVTVAETLFSMGKTDTANNNINALAVMEKLGMPALKPIISPYLTDTNNWYLLCTNRLLKPIILQQRQTPEFGALEGSSDKGFMSKHYVYGVDERKAVGYALWQCAYGSLVA